MLFNGQNKKFRDARYFLKEEQQPVNNQNIIINTNTFQKIPQELIDAEAPLIKFSQGGKTSFQLNGKNYIIDVSNVFPDLFGNWIFISGRIDDKLKSQIKGLENAKPGSIMIGFMNLNASWTRVIYVDNSGKIQKSEDNKNQR